jgi:hypothetical protein
MKYIYAINCLLDNIFAMKYSVKLLEFKCAPLIVNLVYTAVNLNL